MSSENPIKVIPHYVVCPLGIKFVGQIHLRIRLSHLTNWSISSLQTIHCVIHPLLVGEFRIKVGVQLSTFSYTEFSNVTVPVT